MSDHKKHFSKKNIHDKSIIIFLSIALFVIIIFGSLNVMIFNKDFYTTEYSKNHVYEKLSSDPVIADEIAKNATDDLTKYFRTYDTRELRYYTSTEMDHMKDVRGLIHTMQFIYYGAALLAIALFLYCYQKFKDDRLEFIRILSRTLLYSSIAAITFLVITFLMCVFQFDFTFTLFHIIFFPQGNWMFDPTSMLITLFPEQFFFDISLRIFIYAMFQALIFFGIGYWMRKQLKNQEMHHR
jgi:integral membrane protein (TIGR01906 family)